jgi:MFS family permease
VVFLLTSLRFFMLGAASGPAADRLGSRPLVLAGAAAFGLGLAATAVDDRLWIAYLTYGVGVGCSYVPIIAALAGWSERRRAGGRRGGLRNDGGFDRAICPLLPCTCLLVGHHYG